MQAEKHYWFRAKTYGWGWGLPTAWQGWLVYAGFFAFLALGFLFLQPAAQPVIFGAYVVVLGLLLVATCWAKGESPSWRWGK